jgi:hypothetical protein
MRWNDQAAVRAFQKCYREDVSLGDSHREICYADSRCSIELDNLLQPFGHPHSENLGRKRLLLLNWKLK